MSRTQTEERNKLNGRDKMMTMTKTMIKWLVKFVDTVLRSVCEPKKLEKNSKIFCNLYRSVNILKANFTFV